MRNNNTTVWAVHLLTASGAGIALLALIAAAQGDWPTVFILLGLALVVDTIDGPLARRLQTATRVSWFDGASLDLIVDYTTYVLVPAMVVVLSDLLPSGLRVGSGLVIAVVGALYLADTRMKTSQDAFRGFPAVWNAVVFQLIVFRLPETANLLIIAAFAVLTFVPVEFVHPFRVRQWRTLTSMMALAWGGLAVAAVAMDLRPGGAVTGALAVASLYLALVGAVQQVVRWKTGAR